VAIEKIVRPFQSGDVFNARVLLPPVPPTGFSRSQDACLLTWSGKNPGTFVTVEAEEVTGFKAEWKEDKSQRITEKVRVENPDDAQQYVEVERMKQAVFKNTGTSKSMILKFDTW
jgi:hypothetical protein